MNEIERIYKILKEKDAGDYEIKIVDGVKRFVQRKRCTECVDYLKCMKKGKLPNIPCEKWHMDSLELAMFLPTYGEEKINLLANITNMNENDFHQFLEDREIGLFLKNVCSICNDKETCKKTISDIKICGNKFSPPCFE